MFLKENINIIDFSINLQLKYAITLHQNTMIFKRRLVYGCNMFTMLFQ